MWQQVINQRVLQYNTPYTFNHLFRSSIITVNAALNIDPAFPFGKRTYKLAATLFPIFYSSETGLNKGDPRRLYLGNRQVAFNNRFSYAYNLEIHIHLWTPHLDIRIWESDEEVNIDTTIKLERIQNSLNSIEDKVDRINQTNP